MHMLTCMHSTPSYTGPSCQRTVTLTLHALTLQLKSIVSEHCEDRAGLTDATILHLNIPRAALHLVQETARMQWSYNGGPV